MPEEGNMLQAAVVFLFAAVITVPLAKRLQLGAVLGYLFAGVVIGPQVLGWVNNPQAVSNTCARPTPNTDLRITHRRLGDSSRPMMNSSSTTPSSEM